MNRCHFSIIASALVIALSLLSSCTGTTSPIPSGDSYISNGQRIYFTATSSSGEAIIPEGFSMMMQRIACADCHGAGGKGGTVYMMMQRFDVPNITWLQLTAGEYEDHPPYTEETVKRAITQGLDPAGNELEEFMPHWQISAPDLNDLVDFLKTLK